MGYNSEVLVAYRELTIEDDRLTNEESIKIKELMHSLDESNIELVLSLLKGFGFDEDELDNYNDYIDYIIKLDNEFDNKRIRSDKDNTVVYYTDVYRNMSYMNVESIISEIEEYTETDYCRIGEYGEDECNQTLGMFSVVHYIDGMNETHNT